MIATGDAGADCAYALGKACWERGIQTAGLVLGDGTSSGTAASAAVAALRPHARVLLPSADETRRGRPVECAPCLSGRVPTG